MFFQKKIAANKLLISMVLLSEVHRSLSRISFNSLPSVKTKGEKS